VGEYTHELVLWGEGGGDKKARAETIKKPTGYPEENGTFRRSMRARKLLLRLTHKSRGIITQKLRESPNEGLKRYSWDMKRRT